MLLFPAYAGVILTLSAGVNTRDAFPRVCGGDPGRGPGGYIHLRFSPRMRG